MKLKSLRDKIDRIDEKILKLLNQRAGEAIKVSEVKEKSSSRIYSPAREANILNQLKKKNRGPLTTEDTEMVFGEILSVCRSQKTVLRAAYLGPQGTFTHLATIKKFGKKSEYIPSESIGEVFERVEKGEVDYGVVPIENSIEGVVNYTLDMFFVSTLKICAEVTLNVSHSLLGTSLKFAKSKIKKIYSNPQVFAQCRKWISRNMPDIELIPVSSTAYAAQAVKKDSEAACIGNKILTNLYGLKIIATPLQDSPHNFTRFLIIAKNDSLPSGRDKTSILFSIKDKVGALCNVLTSFEKYRISLTKIESRPSKRKPWEYYFFVDFTGHRNLTRVQKVLKELKKGCLFVKILGSYPTES